jgi:hypothetical protein
MNWVLSSQESGSIKKRLGSENNWRPTETRPKKSVPKKVLLVELQDSQQKVVVAGGFASRFRCHFRAHLAKN